MIKLYICCLFLIIGSVEVGPDRDIKFHQEVMKIVSFEKDIKSYQNNSFHVEMVNKWKSVTTPLDCNVHIFWKNKSIPFDPPCIVLMEYREYQRFDAHLGLTNFFQHSLAQSAIYIYQRLCLCN